MLVSVTKVKDGYFWEQRTGAARLFHRRYFVFVGPTGRTKRMEFPRLVPRPAPFDWGRQESRKLMQQLTEARQQIQAPAAYIAEQMGVVPEIIYRLEGTDRDPRLSTVIRYAKALGLDLKVEETPYS